MTDETDKYLSIFFNLFNPGSDVKSVGSSIYHVGNDANSAGKGVMFVGENVMRNVKHEL